MRGKIGDYPVHERPIYKFGIAKDGTIQRHDFYRYRLNYQTDLGNSEYYSIYGDETRCDVKDLDIIVNGTLHTFNGDANRAYTLFADWFEQKAKKKEEEAKTALEDAERLFSLSEATRALCGA